MLEEKLTYRIRGCVYKVSRQLGSGFLEKVYENALVAELKNSGLKVEQQQPVAVNYKGAVVGEYIVDLLIEDTVLLELKAQDTESPVWEAQLLNYLKATGMRLGLLVNFKHPKASIKRFVV